MLELLWQLKRDHWHSFNWSLNLKGSTAWHSCVGRRLERCYDGSTDQVAFFVSLLLWLPNDWFSFWFCFMISEWNWGVHTSKLHLQILQTKDHNGKDFGRQREAESGACPLWRPICAIDRAAQVPRCQGEGARRNTAAVFAIDTSFFLSCLWRPLWLLVNANVW